MIAVKYLQSPTLQTRLNASHILHAPVARADCLPNPKSTSADIVNKVQSILRQELKRYVTAIHKFHS